MEKTGCAVIFDMDGVIFDSERAFIDSFKEICDEEQMEFKLQACIDCIGVNWNSSKRIFEEAYGPDFDFPHYFELVRSRMRTLRFPLKPCVREILGYLSGRGTPMALASSTREVTVRRMLGDEGLLSYFDAVICGDMVSHSKPHPEIFLTAAERLNADPSDCYVIEDSYNGIRCAHNAGMHPIMVPDILQPDDEIGAMAEIVLPTLGDVITYFEEVL